jgi:hypothetical protein
MPVYMVQAGDEFGPVKIGHGVDPVSRLENHQTGNHLELKLLRTFVGGVEEEAALHDRFALFRIRGEWFRFTDAMMGDVGLEEIAETVPPFPKIPIRIAREIAAAWCKAFGLQREAT